MSDAVRKHDYNFLPVLDRHERGGTVQRIQDAVRDAIVRLVSDTIRGWDAATITLRRGGVRWSVEVDGQGESHVARVD